MAESKEDYVDLEQAYFINFTTGDFGKANFVTSNEKLNEDGKTKRIEMVYEITTRTPKDKVKIYYDKERVGRCFADN